MRSFFLLLAGGGLLALPLPAQSDPDPNQAVRVALQADLEDFSVADWAARPAPARGPAWDTYLRRLGQIADDPQWRPSVRAGTIPLARPDGTTVQLAITLYEAEGPTAGTLLFVHGYMSHAANFAYTFQYFTKRGYRVVTLDLPGHGLSTGPRSDVDSFSEYGDAVQAWLNWVDAGDWPRPHVLLAHSLGSAAVFEALRRPQTPRPDRLVFCAPLLRVDWHPALQGGNWAFGWFWKRIPTTFGWDGYLDGYSMPVHWFAELDRWLNGLASQPPLALPLTIYSGDRDNVVDEGWNRTEYQRLVPSARYRLLPGYGHLFLTEQGQRELTLSLLAAELGLRTP